MSLNFYYMSFSILNNICMSTVDVDASEGRGGVGGVGGLGGEGAATAQHGSRRQCFGSGSVPTGCAAQDYCPTQ